MIPPPVLPPAVRAAFHMLRGQPAPNLSPAEWDELLAFTDRTQLTLHLLGVPGLPGPVQQQIAARRARNLARRERLGEEYARVARALQASGIPFVVLKGFTHEVGFGIDPSLRVQYDLDLLCRPSDLPAAHESLRAAGYRPHGEKRLSAEHSRPLVRPFDWRWRGDYFDPGMPAAVELHGSLWDSAHDRIAVNESALWDRREWLDTGGLRVPALDEDARFDFAALHLLRHVLRNDARPAHAFELAQLLRTRPLGRRGVLESAGFRFAAEWFGTPYHADLPPGVESWFCDFAWSPIANLVRPNKDAIWLHLALLGGWRDRAHVLAHRLTPFRLPHPQSGFGERLRYHAGAFAPALWSGLRWWRRRAAASTAAQISDWNRRSV